MNPATPSPPAPIPLDVDLSARLLDPDNQVIATGELRLNASGQCHFSPGLHETLNSEADDPNSIEIDGFGIHSIQNWNCQTSRLPLLRVRHTFDWGPNRTEFELEYK